MPSLELVAKSVEEARTLAADRLGVAPDAVNVTVLEETKGLFGKTNVRVRAETAAPAVEKSAPAPKAEVKPEPTPEEEPARESGRGRRGGRGRGAKAEEAPVAVEATAVAEIESAPEPARGPREERAPREEREDAVATQESADRLAALVRELLAAGGLEADVTLRNFEGRYVNLAIGGKDAGHLVGKHGEVINALQYLVNVIAGRKYNDGIRANLDGNDYRAKREAALTKYALQLAEQVRERGEEVVFEPLPAFERRIVHNVVSSVAGVKTYSEGEEPNRRIVISPED